MKKIYQENKLYFNFSFLILGGKYNKGKKNECNLEDDEIQIF